MVYGFENRKSFSDFEYLILKLMYPVKTCLGPCQNLPKTQPGTLTGPARDLTETHLGLYRDLP
jgi:hypothetical protein